MRILVTGATGFVGRHMSAFSRARGAGVVGVARKPNAGRESATLGELRFVDLADRGQTSEVIRDVRPDWVFHLAADASVARSWSAPDATLQNNLVSALNVLEAVRVEAPSARVLVAGSGEQYGPVPAERQPIVEEEPLRPQSPYGVSKSAVDLLAGFYADAHGLRIVRTRAFNHAGPGQERPYVVASLAGQVAAAELAGHGTLNLRSGDLTVRRDFTDVRDVVRAYWLALERCPEDVYNVCSGRSVPLTQVVTELQRCSSVEIRPVRDPQLLRPVDVRAVTGSREKLTRTCGWRPEIEFATTVGDALQSWRDRLGAAP